MFVLGLTGSIGMGKSATARMFAEAGVPVHEADAAVHRLYEGEAVPAIEAAFPGAAAGGKVDREKLAARVLGDAAALAAARKHRASAGARFGGPFPRRGRSTAAPRSRCSTSRCCSRPAARTRVDAVVVVSAPAAVQRARVLARPGMTPEKFEALLAKQMPDAEKRRRADFVVDTSQGLDAARAQVDAILRAQLLVCRTARQ